ncbi:haloacid dehalogenase type II [Sphingomonas oligophenolica]|uniref:(S)-2-haloacid dehalogenase n=1 Tax=Sphingomonas oligophenolica TaxID=301154 RepID=A0A502CHU7_9SPHN|nr:haloacid dehalogenase type II [Sphingomonas oligophenolica]TPG12174.1 haloacid dehalogenase type II [Sphingomonas oligophenolica]
MRSRPAVIIFDVNETLLDIAPLEPLFDEWFGDAATMRQWFAQLVLYSQSLTLAGRYVDFGAIGAAVLGMVAQIRGCELPGDAADRLATTIGALPAHGDVVEGLERLKSAGFRIVTLTNSGAATQRRQLEHAGIDHLFEAQFSVEAVRAFKPARATYEHVADALGVEIGATMLVACHAWDIVGARAAGCQTGFVCRSGNAELAIDDGHADVSVATLAELAEKLRV